MTMGEATRTCLRKYFQFSGRASRSEFWRFALVTFLASLAVSVLNAAIFGPVTENELVVTLTQDGTPSNQLRQSQIYGPGPLTPIITLVLLVPYLAAIARRLHDIGRSIWSGVVAFAIPLGLLGVTIYGFLETVPTDPSILAQIPDFPAEISLPAPPAALLAISVLSAFGAVIWFIVVLARQGDSAANRYGPPPATSELGLAK